MKKVKVESLGENIFIFKFSSKEERKGILHRGLWHFNNSLMVLIELTSVDDIKQQDGQRNNVGNRKEDWQSRRGTNGRNMGMYWLVCSHRNLVDITKPLEKKRS